MSCRHVTCCHPPPKAACPPLCASSRRASPVEAKPVHVATPTAPLRPIWDMCVVQRRWSNCVGGRTTGPKLRHAALFRRCCPFAPLLSCSTLRFGPAPAPLRQSLPVGMLGLETLAPPFDTPRWSGGAMGSPAHESFSKKQEKQKNEISKTCGKALINSENHEENL